MFYCQTENLPYYMIYLSQELLHVTRDSNLEHDYVIKCKIYTFLSNSKFSNYCIECENLKYKTLHSCNEIKYSKYFRLTVTLLSAFKFCSYFISLHEMAFRITAIITIKNDYCVLFSCQIATSSYYIINLGQ